MVDSATVKGKGPQPKHVTITFEGGGAAQSTRMSTPMEGDAWEAHDFTGGVIGTEIDPSGTWSIVVTMLDGVDCAEVSELTLELKTSYP